MTRNIAFIKTPTKTITGIDVNGRKWGAIRYVPATKHTGPSATITSLDESIRITTSSIPTARSAMKGPTLREVKAHAMSIINAR